MKSIGRHIILILLFLIPFYGETQTSLIEKEIKVVLRKVGHQLLLKTSDSISRVLPIEKYDSSYIIRFENELSFNPEDLSNIMNNVMIESGLQSEYIVEVKSCFNGEVSHSFKKTNIQSEEELACAIRTLPKDCYQIAITFSSLDDSRTEEEESNSVWFILAVLIIPLVLIAVLVFWMFRKNKKENPHWISLGKFHFDKLNTELILKEQRIELTSKEADLLILLHENVNQTVERDTILNQVWGDDGDYIGRTLDVFISKLRKKLEPDPNIKIVNVRGVGYKLIVNQS